MSKNKLVDVNNLKVHFPVYGGVLSKRVATVKAVDDINFKCIPDYATGMSKKYETVKGSGVIRQMYIILGSRNSSRST